MRCYHTLRAGLVLVPRRDWSTSTERWLCLFILCVSRFMRLCFDVHVDAVIAVVSRCFVARCSCVSWCALALSGETVEHGDVCLLDAPPSALTPCETDLHGNVSIDFGDFVCICGYGVLLVALPISFAFGSRHKSIWVLGSLPHCCAAPVVWLCPLHVSLDVVAMPDMLSVSSCCLDLLLFLQPRCASAPTRRIPHPAQQPRSSCASLHLSRLDRREEVSRKRVYWVLFGLWLDSSPFPGLRLWLSCSSVLHELPSCTAAACEAFLRHFAIVIYGFSNWLGTPGGHDAFASAYTMLLHVIEGSSTASGVLLEWQFASSLAVCWDDIWDRSASSLAVVQGSGGRQARALWVAWQVRATPRVDVAKVPIRLFSRSSGERRHTGFCGWRARG